MIFVLGGLTSSIKRGWQYIVSSVVRDIGQLSQDAKTIADELGLDISEVTKYQDVAKDALDAWQKLIDLPDFYRVTSKFGIETPFDYRDKYIMQMKVHAWDKNTGEFVDQWITVESGSRKTKQEWFELARQATIDTPFGTDLVLEYATDFRYYERT